MLHFLLVEILHAKRLCVGISVDVCVTHMCVDMRVGMCVDMCTDVRADMCVDMHAGIVQTCA